MNNFLMSVMVGCVMGGLTACRSGSDGKSDVSEKAVTSIYQDYRESLASGDVMRIKNNVSDRYAKEILAPGQEMKFDLLKALAPETVEIEGVSASENEAVVRCRGVKDGMRVKGTTTLVKEGGAWKISNESWNFESSAPSEPASTSDAVAPTSNHPGDTPSTSDQQSVEELMAQLKDPDLYGKEAILDSLLQQGAREEAVRALNEMLRRKPDFPNDVKRLLKRAGAPVTFNWRRNSFEPKETEFAWREFDVEFKNGAVISSGRAYIGRDVIEGFSRQQNTETPMPMFAQYNFRLKGANLPAPIEKVVDVERRAGEHFWNDLQIAAGLGKGEYEVSVLLHAQTVKTDGVPISMNAGPVILTVDGE